MLTGAALGCVAAALAALVLWWQREPLPRASAASLAAVGALVGSLWAVRRRWADPDVALYLDARLETAELISTALALRDAHGTAAHSTVVARAIEQLVAMDPRRTRPRVLLYRHALGPAGLVISGALVLAPLPARPAPPSAPPGTKLVRLAELTELDAATDLEHVRPRDAQQQRRLEELAERARKLKDELRIGMPLREAQAEIARLREDIAAERLSLSDTASRPGLEAAMAELEKNRELERAAKLLGNGDLTEFDREMRELANRVEARDRDAALESLAEAARSAAARGNHRLEQLLDEERKLFEQRNSHASALRELARSLDDKLGPAGKNALGELGRSGSPEAEAALGKALGDALDSLSPEERRRVAENLARGLGESRGGTDPLTRRELEEMAKRLETPEGRAELKKMLQDLARSDPSDEARRERGLGDAERGAGKAERRLRALPVPIAAPGGAGSGSPPPGGSSGHSEDTGTGDHTGSTREAHGDELRAKANVEMRAGPMHVTTEGRAPARAGETANQRGTGALERALPGEVGAVERSEVPEEYREQVGRYFQP